MSTPGAVGHAGVAPTRKRRALHDALRRAIAHRRGYCSWTVDHAGWVVALHSPEEQDFYWKTLEEALPWRLVWLMAKGTPGDWGLGTGHPTGLDRGNKLGGRPCLV